MNLFRNDGVHDNGYPFKSDEGNLICYVLLVLDGGYLGASAKL
jgi:hypothetical protein